MYVISILISGRVFFQFAFTLAAKKKPEPAFLTSLANK